MMETRKKIWEGKTIIRNVLIVIIICAIGGYTGFQSKKIISGPQITIQSPKTTSTDSGVVDVSGIVKNFSVVTLNDRMIPVDEGGKFKEKVLLYSGYNVIKVEATDKFGAHTKKELQVVYTDDSKSDVKQDLKSDVKLDTNSTSSVDTKDTKSSIKAVNATDSNSVSKNI
jgi:Glucodextranase, domain B